MPVHSLSPTEREYRATERDYPTVVWALTILRPYLEHRHFTFHTERQALRWIFDLAMLSGKLGRWRLRLLEFDFTVKYKKGSANTITDSISRLPTYRPTTANHELYIKAFTVSRAFLDHGIFCNGVPTRLISHNGSQFTAKLLWSPLRVKNIFSTTYHPQSNGQTERFNMTRGPTGFRPGTPEHLA